MLWALLHNQDFYYRSNKNKCSLIAQHHQKSSKCFTFKNCLLLSCMEHLSMEKDPAGRNSYFWSALADEMREFQSLLSVSILYRIFWVSFFQLVFFIAVTFTISNWESRWRATVDTCREKVWKFSQFRHACVANSLKTHNGILMQIFQLWTRFTP